MPRHSRSRPADKTGLLDWKDSCHVEVSTQPLLVSAAMMSKNLALSCLQILILVATLKSCAGLDFKQNDLQKAIFNLWNADTNSATDDQYYLDYQEHTNSNDRVDNAAKKLFRKMDQTLLKQPTYQALIDLFDAYDSNSATTAAKANAFLDKISTTGVYKNMQQFLASQGYQPAKNDADFRKAIFQLWFGDYGRGSSGQSSGFEHVFIGEVKNGQVTGLHNWIRMYYLEQKGKLDYTGFIIKRAPRVPILQFKIGDAWKPTGSVMVGTSPEFDFAIFTLCFLGKPGESACKFFLGDCTAIEVSSHPYNVRGNIFIGTVYPSPWRTDGLTKCPLE